MKNIDIGLPDVSASVFEPLDLEIPDDVVFSESEQAFYLSQIVRKINANEKKAHREFVIATAIAVLSLVVSVAVPIVQHIVGTH